MKCHTPNCLNKRVPGYPVCQDCIDGYKLLVDGSAAKADQELRNMSEVMEQATDMFKRAGREVDT